MRRCPPARATFSSVRIRGDELPGSAVNRCEHLVIKSPALIPGSGAKQLRAALPNAGHSFSSPHGSGHRLGELGGTPSTGQRRLRPLISSASSDHRAGASARARILLRPASADTGENFSIGGEK